MCFLVFWSDRIPLFWCKEQAFGHGLDKEWPKSSLMMCFNVHTVRRDLKASKRPSDTLLAYLLEVKGPLC